MALVALSKNLKAGPLDHTHPSAQKTDKTMLELASDFDLDQSVRRQTGSK
jgi:hypothetical protein